MSNNSVIIDARMKSKIADLMDWSKNDIICYSVNFKDIEDCFWFGDKNTLQEFLNNQAVERFYDKELRKGYFDYVNENGEILRYHVKSNRGSLQLIKEECLH